MHRFGRTTFAATLGIAAVIAGTQPGGCRRINQRDHVSMLLRRRKYQERPRLTARIVDTCYQGELLPIRCFVNGDSSNGSTRWYRWTVREGNRYIHSSQVWVGSGGVVRC